MPVGPVSDVPTGKGTCPCHPGRVYDTLQLLRVVISRRRSIGTSRSASGISSMSYLLAHADDLLRGRTPISDVTRRGTLLHLLALITVFGVLYGAVMGTFGGVQGQRALQLLYSGVKVPLLLLVTF